jgi:hypothetical protein
MFRRGLTWWLCIVTLIGSPFMPILSACLVYFNRLIHEHDGNAISNRVSEPAVLAHESRVERFSNELSGPISESFLADAQIQLLHEL